MLDKGLRMSDSERDSDFNKTTTAFTVDTHFNWIKRTSIQLKQKREINFETIVVEVIISPAAEASKDKVTCNIFMAEDRYFRNLQRQLFCSITVTK